MSSPPLDLYGRPRADRLMRALTAFGDTYIPFSTRPRRRRSPAARAVPPLTLVVAARRTEAEGVVSLRLAAPDGARLPAWQPGAHLDLQLPSGRRRQYSLCGDPADRTAYRIAVRRIETGGGGSVEVHDDLPEGTRLTVKGPRNAFPFAAEPRVLLIAGGIGITPLLPMAREAARLGLDWRLVHTGRSRATLPFTDELRQLRGPVEILADDEHGIPDASDLLSRDSAGTAVYACGPGPMLDGIRAAFDDSPAAGLHFERFAPAPIRDGRPFELQLARSGRTLTVPADRSALDVLSEAVPAAAYSCRQGFCGVCRQRVLAGPVEHRDRRLTDAERTAGEMLVCVSRAPEGERLVLDL
ncbi:PDR/VanB family oxidoreductase [Streptomyces justiciae]|uniref:PDR/VanB family oxidoreductase n=1 Tax=Streptomyces justiciae TaxID=2780140 RepID=UPI0021192E5D|nr:PDR/VanB family oxidoreductase [Streptomyces justiciae]MCW8380653.1 PDR/VanB family oxidoreductase [Streptomyces justiciae]